MLSERQAAAFGVVLGGDDAFDLTGKVTDGLGELRLFVGEENALTCSPSTLFGSAVADHHSLVAVSRRKMKLPQRSSVGSAFQRETDWPFQLE